MGEFMNQGKTPEWRILAKDVLVELIRRYGKAYRRDAFSRQQQAALLWHLAAGGSLFDLVEVIVRFRTTRNVFSKGQIFWLESYIEAGSRSFNRQRWLKLVGLN